MDRTGSSPQYIFSLSLIIVTLYYFNSLLLRSVNFILCLEYSFFTMMVLIMWVIFNLNTSYAVVLKNSIQNEFLVLYPVLEEPSYLLGLTNLQGQFTYSRVLFSWESWLTVDAYSYPFAYTFFVVIILSFINCLAYHKDELRSFVLFLKMIVVAGFIVFTTNSIIIFFLAYEALLVPSFMILYKFAKSRRCIEAAYAMFF